MNCIAADGAKHRPCRVHRVLSGSIERFFGVLVEHYAGAFPTWPAPVQARLLPVGDDFVKYSQSVADDLRAAGVRVWKSILEMKSWATKYVRPR